MLKYCLKGDFQFAIISTKFTKSCSTDFKGYGYLFQVCFVDSFRTSISWKTLELDLNTFHNLYSCKS